MKNDKPFTQYLIMIVTLSALGVPALAQEQREARKPDLFELMQRENTAASVTQPAGIALESSVNPENYYVGPSDVITVNIWMSPPQNYSLTVTPEGTLIIPTVGEVVVSDLTLAKVKEKVLSTVRKKYLVAEITATLVKPRPVLVNISGTILNPGTYTVNAIDRANRLIELANTPKRDQSMEESRSVLNSMSTRNVVLKHRNGAQDRIDIPKYFATHEDRWNPYLREGDYVVVPGKNIAKFVFAVYGQVNEPGRYELVDGDSVTDAINIAHGMTRLAIAEKAIFSRLNEDGTSLSTQIINLPDIFAGSQPNIALEPGDRIVVQRRNDLRED